MSGCGTPVSMIISEEEKNADTKGADIISKSKVFSSLEIMSASQPDCKMSQNDNYQKSTLYLFNKYLVWLMDASMYLNSETIKSQIATFTSWGS